MQLVQGMCAHSHGQRECEHRQAQSAPGHLRVEAVPDRREVRFRLDARRAPAGVIHELARLVREYPGESPVYVSLETSLGEKTLALGPEYRVTADSDFLAEAKALLGEAAVA